MKLHVCTTCVHFDEKPIEKLKDSCTYLGLNFSSYGVGDKWLGYIYNKSRDLAEYLKKIDSKYILFSDGFDSWMLQDEKTIIKKFEAMKTPIVIGSSFTPHIDYPGIDYSYLENKAFKYVNPGQFIGEKEAIIKALKILVEKAEGETCDNAMWDYAYQSGWFDFKVDHDCELFLAMCVVPIDKIYFKDRRIYNSITKTYPAGIHFNGPRGEHPNGINFERMYKLYLENR